MDIGSLQQVVSYQSMQQLRIKRLLQISGSTLSGLLLALVFASGGVKLIILAGCVALVLSAILAFYQYPLSSAYILLWSMTLMLTALAFYSGGIRDLAVLGYPGVLVFAAILGDLSLFVSLLAAILLSCCALVSLDIYGWYHPHIPKTAWNSLVYVAVILSVSGFSVFLLSRDLHRLMKALQQENIRVHESQNELIRLTQHDGLTGLPNRTTAEPTFKQLLGECQLRGERLVVLFLDLDYFKPVNDALGHSAGDLLLQQLAERLRKELAPRDYLCRFGGDEFLMLLPGIGSDTEVISRAERILRQTSQHFQLMQTQVEISGSLGISVVPRDGVDFASLLKRADMAMFQAKTSGRNIWRFYDEIMDKANVDKFNLLQKLRGALKESQFQLYYQPKINLQTGQIDSAEALVRWPQTDGSFIAPQDFIGLCEESGLINELGYWVLVEACKACRRWQLQGFTEMTIAVNLSFVQFRDGLLEAKVQQALREAELPATALELELTESLLIGEGDNISLQLAQLGTLGVSFAIDDFGTGYSNLGYLRRFNATTLKIDKSFIHSLCISDRDEPLVHAIIQMGHSLGLKIVAEGVEDAATVARLTELSCDSAQGYFWSKPVAEVEFINFLVSRRQGGS